MVSFAKRKRTIEKNVNFHWNIVYDAANAIFYKGHSKRLHVLFLDRFIIVEILPLDIF